MRAVSNALASLITVKHNMDKLGANDRTQALAIALRRGLLQL
jgi:DNA-binding CsgD family transcriptional regulator